MQLGHGASSYGKSACALRQGAWQLQEHESWRTCSAGSQAVQAASKDRVQLAVPLAGALLDQGLLLQRLQGARDLISQGPEDLTAMSSVMGGAADAGWCMPYCQGNQVSGQLSASV